MKYLLTAAILAMASPVMAQEDSTKACVVAIGTISGLLAEDQDPRMSSLIMIGLESTVTFASSHPGRYIEQGNEVINTLMWGYSQCFLKVKDAFLAGTLWALANN